ncbi:C15orf24 protein [Trypanosoma rangeli]|uniref:C15orf24 protein n=1 Tax=Trypanosoma rangeli TaxID=5698 RepID=A0A422N2I9_TRYRA|nr:C15orf24 protein [Trypanosoma rangeli]RNE99688.1 C15orf24 protein [Trypanosoma rangeli]|eukprot:RNE99688.1 C15orf24 protein [Trypanosoma rangeli]
MLNGAVVAGYSSLFVLLFLLCAIGGVAAQQEQHPTTPAYYGRLSIHPNFFHHADARNPLWHVQGGEVVLSNGAHLIRVPTQTDGSFVVHNIPHGSYHLHAEYANFIYPTVRVDVTQKTAQGVTRLIIRTYTNDGTMVPVQGTGLDDSSPAIIPHVGVHEYYVPREQYSLWNFLTNPMLLLMVFSMVMIGVMQLMPEEDRKESAREMQRLRRQWAGEEVEDKKTPALAASGKKSR